MDDKAGTRDHKGDAGETQALRLAATARKWLEDVSVDREGHVHPAVASGGKALTALATAGARVSLAEPGRVVCSLRVRAPLTVRCLALPADANARLGCSLSPDLTWCLLVHARARACRTRRGGGTPGPLRRRRTTCARRRCLLE